MKNSKTKINQIKQRFEELQKARDFYKSIEFSKRTKRDDEAIYDLANKIAIYREILFILEK